MLALLSALLLLASAELTTIYEHGQFTSEVGLYDPGLDASEHVMRVYFNPPRCVSAFEVRVNGGETPAIVETVVGHQDGKYLWKTIGSAVITPENRAITLEDAPHCVSRFRVTIEKGVYTGVWADTEEAPNTRKRAISCTFSATDKWPNTCKSSSAGTQCLTLATPNFCGCTEDGDCFADVSHPFCNVAGNPGPSGDGPGTCVKCTYAPGTTTVPQQGYACRLRTPSRYFADASLATKTQSPGFNLIQFSQGEQIPTESYFKEVCISGSNSGACERCDQASSTNAPDYNIAYPDYTGAKPTGDVSQDGSFQDGLRGSYFCKTVYGATSPHPQRPVCISNGVFAASGLSSIFQNYVLTMEIGHFGTGTPSDAPGAPVPTDPATTGVDTPRLVVEWEGACGPCVLQSAITGGTSIRLHTICSYTQATTPICDADPTKGCRGCATNADCGVQTAACLTDGSASCTGGKNCQANGSCKTCTLDSDCGLLDGGENKLQAKCDVASGLCVDAFSCTGNVGQLTAADCSALNGGNNCQKDGTCKTCTTNADCGTLDGGTTQNQQVCNTVTGICGSCTTNANCVGTTGANCQKDGTCVDCTTAPATVCGAADGGAPTVSTCTAGVFCADANDQSICNAGTKRCEPPCLSNAWCSGKRTAQAGVTTNNGANCGSSGICADCQTPGSPSTIPNSANCGTVDGPPTGLTGTTGAAGQTSCDPSGICVDPFTCTTNPSCSGAPAAPFSCTDTTTSCANCQVGGSCLPCVVDYTTSTCGAGLDGGEVVSQVNCRTASRQCVAACTSSDNTGCAGTQGANCMANGVCFNCRDDSDCKTGNAWGGDFGGQTVCISTICTDPCASNTICGANSNCMKDGRCKPCTNDADCVANDGPPPMGTDIKCNSGVCIPPYTCSGASGTPADNNGCKTNTGSNNCMADGTCKTCTKDSDCIGDGGAKPNQPKCDVASGTCVECGSNADCLGTGVALNCDDDGLCRDCRTYPSGFACNTRDGPAAGLPSRNPNCDTLTGICVDFCVKDSDCTDACAPVCNLERGCCVECNTNSNCPVAQWRGAQKAYTQCSADFHCVLPSAPPSSGHACDTDADCGGSTPACDFGRQICVQCLADSHCNRTSGTPACHIGSRRCVDCTDNSYCVNDKDADGNPKWCSSANTCESSSGLVSVSLFSALLLVIARLM